MARVAGVDPGTGSFDLCILEDGRFLEGLSLPTREVHANPQLLIEALHRVGPLDLIAGPSGHGLPLKPLSQVSGEELLLAALVKPGDAARILGLRRVLERLKSSGLPVVMLPSVKHLPTVPAHRKLNRIDLGTADKLCSAALAILDQAERLRIPPSETSFLLVELGYAFAALLRVEGGAVVAGLGGSLGPIGLLSPGSLDGEIAYLLGEIPKRILYAGGILKASGFPEGGLEGFLSGVKRGDERCLVCWEAFHEGILGAAAQLIAVSGRPREILISGRLSRVEEVFREVSRRLSGFGRVQKVKGFTDSVKEAAQGAAVIADGLLGGRYKAIVEALRLKEAGGSVLDHIYLEGFEEIRKLFP